MAQDKRKKLGIFSFTSCEGCLVEFLSLGKDILDITKHFEITNFPPANERFDLNGPFDIALVEGSIDREELIKDIQTIRKNTKFLVAFGACATHGGIQSINNFFDKERLVETHYGKDSKIEHLDNEPLDKYVHVDYYMYGCPVYHPEILDVLKKIILGATPRQTEKPVCYECRLNQNECLLQKGQACLGPVTNQGCDSICTNAAYPCTGCRGPLADDNLPQFIELLRSKGFTSQDIDRLFSKYEPACDKWIAAAKKVPR